jgi:hypothetical protein
MISTILKPDCVDAMPEITERVIPVNRKSSPNKCLLKLHEAPFYSQSMPGSQITFPCSSAKDMVLGIKIFYQPH